MTRILVKREAMILNLVGLFADGATVKTITKDTLRVCDKMVNDMVMVGTNQIRNAIKLIYNDASKFWFLSFHSILWFQHAQ